MLKLFIFKLSKLQPWECNASIHAFTKEEAIEKYNLKYPEHKGRKYKLIEG